MKRATEQGIVLATATIASFFVPYLTSSITVALPAIGKEFSLDAVVLGWIVSSYVLATAICIVPFGRFADIVGRKKLFLAGIALMTVSCLFAALAWSPEALIAFRVLQGAGGALIFTTSVAIVVSVFPPDKRGWALGITLASVYTGLSLGPFIGGVLTAYLGWRSIFLVIVPMGIAVFSITRTHVKSEWAEARGARFDLPGSAFYALALFGIMYGLTLVPEPGSAFWLAVGISLLAGFLWWEHRSTSPVLDLSVFSGNVTFTFSNLAAMINYAATYGVTFLLSLYLQYTRGFSPEAAGLVLVAQPVVQAVFSPLAGRLSDRIEPRTVASAGMALTTTGLFLFIFLTDNAPLVFVVGVLMLLGLGYGLFSSPNTNAIMSSVDRRHYGVASSMVATMRAIGQMTSMALVMMIFSLVMGRVVVTPEVYPLFLESLHLIFIVMTVLCLFGVFASIARGNVKHPDENG
ncbi:EmrB/QacA subfamily drug resistance transporter [Methanolinea mesophila]|uniref:MFS transporter n=1 Tax=Methanolinea mesophila TaxID=547055 RepID=UPI001AE62FCA|nr:MFS transporter [Methanolinea mesophila]MBP1929809.1 EmrB/QacA subfamily drug resistance transporter [Methanolinea mesophila]